MAHYMLNQLKQCLGGVDPFSTFFRGLIKVLMGDAFKIWSFCHLIILADVI